MSIACTMPNNDIAIPQSGRRLLSLACAVVGLAALAAGRAEAQEIEPNDFIALPPGTNLALGYYIYGDQTQFNSVGTAIPEGTYKDKTGLQVNIAVARYVHYTEIAGVPAGFEVYQAFGGLSGGQIGGEQLSNAFGAQNLAMAAFVWPYTNKQAGQYLVTAAWLYPPTGTYDPHSNLNVGDNRWRGDFQVGWTQDIGEHFSYDFGLDTMFYADNTDAYPGGFHMSQTPTYRLQAFANWRWTRALQTSIGYEGYFGGIQKLSGSVGPYDIEEHTGQKTEEQRVRAVVSQFLTPAWQVLLELNHDWQAVGGFKQDFGATLRVLYAF